MLYQNFHPTITMTLQDSGVWYGRVEHVFDKHGNELDAAGETAKEVAERLEEQLRKPIDIQIDHPFFR